jgi:hypothetical protein
MSGLSVVRAWTQGRSGTQWLRRVCDPCLAKDGIVIHYTTMQPNQRPLSGSLPFVASAPVGFGLLRPDQLLLDDPVAGDSGRCSGSAQPTRSMTETKHLDYHRGF